MCIVLMSNFYILQQRKMYYVNCIRNLCVSNPSSHLSHTLPSALLCRYLSWLWSFSSAEDIQKLLLLYQLKLTRSNIYGSYVETHSDYRLRCFPGAFCIIQ